MINSAYLLLIFLFLRANHASDLIPGKFLPTTSQCFIPYGGTEVAKEQFEVLMNTGFKWIAASNGYVPENAVVGGRSLSGETFYVGEKVKNLIRIFPSSKVWLLISTGRTMHAGQNTPGKISATSKCIYIPFGSEQSHKDYEVLVQILQPQPISFHRSSGE